jgi:hypothetical protein
LKRRPASLSVQSLRYTDVTVPGAAAPASCRYGDAVLAMAVRIDGFLAVFSRNVTPRTTSPDAAPYVSVNQQLIGC